MFLVSIPAIYFNASGGGLDSHKNINEMMVNIKFFIRFIHFKENFDCELTIISRFNNHFN